MYIFVLEDNPSRVEWLRELVAPRVTVFSAAVAQEFFDLFDRYYDVVPDLVILDHDLGGFAERLEYGSTDINGRTGFDAAHHMPRVACPVLVWSLNTTAATTMVNVLHKRGMRSAWTPYKSKEFMQAIDMLLNNSAY